MAKVTNTRPPTLSGHLSKREDSIYVLLLYSTILWWLLIWNKKKPRRLPTKLCSQHSTLFFVSAGPTGCASRCMHKTRSPNLHLPILYSLKNIVSTILWTILFPTFWSYQIIVWLPNRDIKLIFNKFPIRIQLNCFGLREEGNKVNGLCGMWNRMLLLSQFSLKCAVKFKCIAWETKCTLK